MPTGHMLACPECQLPGDAFTSRAEADLLARTHDRLHHGGHPTAQVTSNRPTSPAGGEKR
jgi:hypothetical protein